VTAEGVQPARLGLVVVDDDEPIRALVRAQAERTPGLDLLADVEDGAPAVRVVADLQPDVVLLDLLMPTPGLEVLPTLHQVAPHVSVIAWSADQRALTQARADGADDAVEKVVPWSEIVARMIDAARSRHSDLGVDPTVRPDEDRGVVRLRRDAIEVHDARPFEFPARLSESATWPCPGCGSRRPLVGAWSLEVANREGHPMQRAVMVCAVCAEALRPESAPAI
jgi:CheY-like chemotaxis protein